MANQKSERQKLTIDSQVQMIEIVQQCKYGFTLDKVSDYIQALDVQGLVCKYGYVLHDQDIIRDKQNAPVLDENGQMQMKEPHVHVDLLFNGRPTIKRLMMLAEPIFGTMEIKKIVGDGVDAQEFSETVPVVRFEHFCKIKNGWESAICYLTHENEPQKHIYPRDVVFANYDIVPDILFALDKISKGHFETELREAILSGNVRRYQIGQFFEGRESYYPRFEKRIDGYFKLRDLQQKDRNREMKVIYITGAPGTGKSTYAKKFCENRNLSYATEGGGIDPLEDYNEQDAFIYSEFRGKGWSQEDLLRLLDNHTSSLQKARYHNKNMYYCKYVILCSVKPLESVWHDTQSFDESEPEKQLKRRVNVVINLFDNGLGQIKQYNDGIEIEGSEQWFKNPVYDMYKDKTPELIDFTQDQLETVEKPEFVNGGSVPVPDWFKQTPQYTQMKLSGKIA